MCLSVISSTPSAISIAVTIIVFAVVVMLVIPLTLRWRDTVYILHHYPVVRSYPCDYIRPVRDIYVTIVHYYSPTMMPVMFDHPDTVRASCKSGYLEYVMNVVIANSIHDHCISIVRE